MVDETVIGTAISKKIAAPITPMSKIKRLLMKESLYLMIIIQNQILFNLENS